MSDKINVQAGSFTLRDLEVYYECYKYRPNGSEGISNLRTTIKRNGVILTESDVGQKLQQEITAKVLDEVYGDNF